jgi:hypothetical protein
LKKYFRPSGLVYSFHRGGGAATAFSWGEKRG